MKAQLFSCMNDLEGQYLDLWERLCRMETPSTDKPALDKQADFLEETAKALGFSVTRVPFEKAGDCLRIDVAGDGSAPVVMMAHVDTVHPVGAFGSEVVRIDGDYMYGPGTCDTKGGAVAALYACHALTKCGISHPPVRIILNTDEEVSNFYSGQEGLTFIRENVRGAQAAFNCETGKAGLITVARKGLLHLDVHIQGKGAHAGNGYFTGISAIREAAHKILALEALSDPEHCTVNCGIVKGGTICNAVPVSCDLEVDVRGLSKEDLDHVTAQVMEIIHHSYVPGTVSTVSTRASRPPMERTEGNEKLFALYAKVAAENGLTPVEPMVRGGTSDASYTTLEGIPTLCSCGPVGDDEHTLNERALRSSLKERALMLALMLHQLAAEHK